MLNKKITWRKQHKWLGIGMSFFMLMFCLSGILLNHRSLIKDVDVSRKYLPSRYEFKNWNGGLLRGTLALDEILEDKGMIGGPGPVMPRKPKAGISM
jgi:hypothetical protein